MMTDKEALKIARDRLSKYIYLSECGLNEGIRAIYSYEAELLCVLIRLAEKEIEGE